MTAAIAPIVERLVGILADHIAATKEPDAEIVAAWRRITMVVQDANNRMQAIKPIQIEKE